MADGSAPEKRLTTSPHYQKADSWSADGRSLVYLDRAEGIATDDLWLLSIEGEHQERPLLQTRFREAYGALSPDGRFLAYLSDESGQMEIYVRPLSSPGGKWKISSEGGTQPVWARSGREIFYRKGDRMKAVPIETESAFRAGRPVVLFEGKFHLPEVSFPQYDVTSDGERFVMVQDLESWPTEVHIILNWFEELKSRVPAGVR
jgi:Tol biopolymer transport system component